MPTADDIRIPYDRDLYVPREATEAEVQGWLAGNGRLLTITSPPATGKSWFLRWLEAQLKQSDGSQVFWIDVCDFLSPTADLEIGARTIDAPQQRQWLQQFLREATERCGQVPTYNADVDGADLLQQFGRAAEQCWPGEKLYLLIEGGDEPTERAWYDIERQILEPIARTASWRVIIVLRKNQRLYSYMLRRGERRLYLGSLGAPAVPTPLPKQGMISAEGRRQIENLIAAEADESLPAVHEILSLAPGYTWSHPGLNHYLFLELKANHSLDRSQWLPSDYRVKGLRAITQLPDEQVGELYGWLEEFAIHLDKTYALDALRQQTGLANTMVWQRLTALQNAGLVEHIGHRIFMPDGLREFIRGSRSIVTLQRDADAQELETRAQQRTFIEELSERLSTGFRRVRLLDEDRFIVTIELDEQSVAALIQLVEAGILANGRIVEVKSNGLATFISDHFNIDELVGLCYDLEVDCDNLPGETIARKSLEIVKFCERRGRIHELVGLCQLLRPNLAVPGVKLKKEEG